MIDDSPISYLSIWKHFTRYEDAEISETGLLFEKFCTFIIIKTHVADSDHFT